MTKKIIKYLSYGAVAVVTFIIGIFISNNQVDAGAPVNGSCASNSIFSCTSWDNSPERHCNAGMCVLLYSGGDDDDSGDGGNEYIDYQ